MHSTFQQPIEWQWLLLQGEVVSNHDELMCNFFAQADALATGKTPVELRAENVPDSLIPHKTFTGNRPSTSVLLPELTAYTVGQILSLYENRIAVQVSLMSMLRSRIADHHCLASLRGGRRRQRAVCLSELPGSLWMTLDFLYSACVLRIDWLWE